MIIKSSTSHIEDGKFRIKKNTLEWVFIISLLLFSFINTTTLIVSLLMLLVFFKQKEIGAIKIINIITFRTIINPGLAVSIGNLEYLKWTILFGCSIYLLLSYHKLDKRDIKKINSIIFPLLLFTIYNIFVAFVFSSLPVVAVFKLISYVVIFVGTLCGVGYTFSKYNWIKWMLTMFKIFIVFSFVIIPLPVSYLRNGTSFQGITNNPNMFGILAVLFIALLLSTLQIKIYIKNITLIVLPIITMLMVFLSKSRTAFISCLVLLCIYLIFLNCNKYLKIITLNILGIGFILLLLNSSVTNFFTEFLYKGQNQGDILFSRANQIETLISNFMLNPWFGNGFSVPVLPFKSYSFSTEYLVEPGNLVLSVLSYSGVIGFLLFLIYIIQIFVVNKENFKNLCFLPIAILLISMGEMVFFSSNNIGIWCYMFLSIYIFFDIKKSKVNL
ncbi:O-antigen ligase family protein [Peribacillus frigoritolerans]|uniref:O-antigen ligase family protein n=1 Tax=Peribacillus frigoritolerans TaxID=450367 RepID=UPI00345DC970